MLRILRAERLLDKPFRKPVTTARNREASGKELAAELRVEESEKEQQPTATREQVDGVPPRNSSRFDRGAAAGIV